MGVKRIILFALLGLLTVLTIDLIGGDVDWWLYPLMAISFVGGEFLRQWTERRHTRLVR